MQPHLINDILSLIQWRFPNKIVFGQNETSYREHFYLRQKSKINLNVENEITANFDIVWNDSSGFYAARYKKKSNLRESFLSDSFPYWLWTHLYDVYR